MQNDQEVFRMNELLDTTETAERLRMHPTTLTTWRTQGRGPRFLKMGSAKCCIGLPTSMSGSTRASAGRLRSRYDPDPDGGFTLTFFGSDGKPVLIYRMVGVPYERLI